MAATAGAIVDTACLLRAATRQIGVLTVDEHQLIQKGLAVMIHREDGVTVVATASSGKEAFTRIRRHRPHVVTLDLLLPDIPEEDLARRRDCGDDLAFARHWLARWFHRPLPAVAALHAAFARCHGHKETFHSGAADGRADYWHLDCNTGTN